MKKKKKIILAVILFIVIALLVVCYPYIAYGIGVLNVSNNSVYKQYKTECFDSFQQFEFTDVQTNLTISYNLFIPVGYNESDKYPLLVYIGDSSTVGKDTTKPLGQEGALIWASDAEQEKHKSFVLVPQYPETILDDHGSYSKTEYVDITERLIKSVENNYNIDTNRVYGTGQSMGCMTIMYLAANYENLFAAEYFVDGQWDKNELQGLVSQTFVYFAAEGDDRASAGQAEVKKMLKASGSQYNEIADIDATLETENMNSALGNFFKADCDKYFISFKKRTVMPWYVPSRISEHMFSFKYCYRVEIARDWLYAQSKQ